MQVSRTSKLRELEHKAQHYELSKNINVEKLVEVLLKQDKENKELKDSISHLKNSLVMAERDYETKLATMRR